MSTGESSNLFEVAEARDRDSLLLAGCYPVGGLHSCLWRMPNGAMLDQQNALDWLRSQNRQPVEDRREPS